MTDAFKVRHLQYIIARNKISAVDKYKSYLQAVNPSSLYTDLHTKFDRITYI